MKNSILFTSYYGLGDQINMRPFVLEARKHYKSVYVATSFADLLYQDTGIKCIAQTSELKTQKEWVSKKPECYSEPLNNYEATMALNYHRGYRNGKSIMQAFNDQFPLGENPDLGLPIKPEWTRKLKDKLSIINTSKKLCVLKLPTLRSEWAISSRNAKMEHFQKLINKYKDEYFFISVADTRNGAEWFSEELPIGIDLCFHNAELDLEEYLALFDFVDMTIGTMSNIVPICLSLQKPVFCVFGGDVPSERIATKPYNLSKYGYAQPNPFSFTFLENYRDKDCNKEIDEAVLFKAFAELKSGVENEKQVID
jgi:hypothetical protein